MGARKARPSAVRRLALTQPTSEAAGEEPQVVSAGVGEGGSVKMRPELFDRIQLGGIGREPFHSEPRRVAFEDLPYVAAAMGGEAVPQQDEGTSPMPLQGLQKTRHLGAADAAPMQGQQPGGMSTVGSGQHGSDSRQPLSVEGFDSPWGLPSWGPRGSKGANFLNHVRSRVASNATVEMDVQAALVLHIANLRFGHKRPARWGVAQKQVEV